MKTIDHDQLANASGGTPKFPGYFAPYGYPYAPYARPYWTPSQQHARPQFAPWGYPYGGYGGYGGYWGAPAFSARPRGWWW